VSEPGVLLGVRRGPFDGCIDRALVQQYAKATNDPSPLVQSGDAVPPVALVTQIWGAENEARATLVSPRIQQTATGGVHGEHDIVLHRPIVPGEALQTWVEGHGARPAGRNALVTLHYLTFDALDALVAEQWWTTVFLGSTCDTAGQPAPDHAFPEHARSRPIATYDVDIDDDMARRYAGVSGDWSPHHFDVDAARRSGFDRVFLHGLCTMALCAQGIVERVADGEPERVRRVAVRFATPAFLREQLHVRIYDAELLGCAFEADCAGTTVITNGRAELRAPVWT
jgi:acyl dehydratase